MILELHEGKIHPLQTKRPWLAPRPSGPLQLDLACSAARRRCGRIVVVARDRSHDNDGSDNRSDRRRAQATGRSCHGSACTACSTRSTSARLCLRDRTRICWFCWRGSLLSKRDGGCKENSNKGGNKTFHSFSPVGVSAIRKLGTDSSTLIHDTETPRCNETAGSLPVCRVGGELYAAIPLFPDTGAERPHARTSKYRYIVSRA